MSVFSEQPVMSLLGSDYLNCNLTLQASTLLVNFILNVGKQEKLYFIQ